MLNRIYQTWCWNWVFYIQVHLIHCSVLKPKRLNHLFFLVRFWPPLVILIIYVDKSLSVNKFKKILKFNNEQTSGKRVGIYAFPSLRMIHSSTWSKQLKIVSFLTFAVCYLIRIFDNRKQWQVHVDTWATNKEKSSRILSFAVDPLNWQSFIEIGEIAWITTFWCSSGHILNILHFQ